MEPPHPYNPLGGRLGALDGGLGCSPLDGGAYPPPSDSRALTPPVFGVRTTAATRQGHLGQPVALPPAGGRGASPKAISERTSYHRVLLVFRPYPQVIRCFFNNNRFGPPPRVTGGSACPGIDHPASGLPWRTRRALRTRLRFGSAIRLNLARHGNSQAHYAKGMRSPLRAPTVWRRMVSGSVSLP